MREFSASLSSIIIIPDQPLIYTAQSFNSKEHLAIVIMSSSASGAAYATEVLAAQKLYCKLIGMPRYTHKT